MAGNTVTVTLEGKGANLQSALDRARSGFGSLERAAHSASGVISRALSTAYGVVIGNTISKAFSSLENAAQSFGEKVVSATVEATDAQLFLRNALRETHGDFAQATTDAEALAKAIGLSTSEAKRLQATAQLGLSGTGVDPTKFLARAADLLASRGRPIAELQETIQQLFAGSDEGIGRLLGGGENPSTLWEQYARSVGKSAGALTDLEKKLAVVSVVMQKGALNTGAATQRLDTLGGKLGALQALITDVAAKVGDALGRNVGVLKLIQGATGFLSKLSTDQASVDALLTKIGEGFVFAANKALDFAKFAARGVNGTIGAVKRMLVVYKQVFLDLRITAEEFWQALQFQAATAVQTVLQAFEGLAIAGVQSVTEVIAGIAAKVRGAATAAQTSGLPGASLIADAASALEQAASSSDGSVERIKKTFDNANQGVADWITRIQKANEGTQALKGQLSALGLQYKVIDDATAAANKTTDAFFDSLRPKLDDFAKFNVPAGTSTTVTKLIEEGDSLTGFPISVAANSEAAKNNTTAVNNMNTKVDNAVGAMKELAGGIGPLEGAINGLKKTLDKGAILDVIAGSGLTVEQVTAGRGTR